MRGKVKGSRYECSECNFTVHLGCAKNPPSPVIEKSKIHEHTLTLLPTHVSFTCNACGLSGDKSPYVCLKCSFMVHGDCIGFPRVIKINRHEHSLYHTCFLGTGEWMCGVCRWRIHTQIIPPNVLRLAARHFKRNHEDELRAHVDSARVDRHVMCCIFLYRTQP